MGFEDSDVERVTRRRDRPHVMGESLTKAAAWSIVNRRHAGLVARLFSRRTDTHGAVAQVKFFEEHWIGSLLHHLSEYNDTSKVQVDFRPVDNRTFDPSTISECATFDQWVHVRSC